MLQLPLTCYLAFLDSGTGLAFWFLFVQVQIIQLQYPTRYLKSNAVTLPLFLCQESREQADYYFISTYATTGYFLTTICKYWIPCYNDIGFSTNLKGIFFIQLVFCCRSFPTFLWFALGLKPAALVLEWIPKDQVHFICNKQSQACLDQNHLPGPLILKLTRF